MQSKTQPTPIGCGGFGNFGKNAETSYYGVSAFMVWATTRVRPYGQINSSDVFPDNYAFCIDHDTHVRASLRGAMPYFIG